MNRERAKELLPIIQAFADGKVIQARAGKGWHSFIGDGAETAFPDEFEYRIRPEPRVLWAYPIANGEYEARANKADTEHNAGVFKAIEVLDDE